ncbi:MAG: urea transporter [Thermaurantimonas sp.]|uniref:urea transporter n=1 Tax=Thermaurantimonas sp. TaxID=2681568 RepID=UPI00391A54B4
MGFSDIGIYILNELYALRGSKLVEIYEWTNTLNLPFANKAYLLSLGAIFFQQNILAGFLASIDLIIYSRIAFSLSIIGFSIVYFFYSILGIYFNEINFSYIGFNYILTSIALGGFFIIPNHNSYITQIFIIPIVIIVGISLQEIFNMFYLSVHSLPFNLVVLTILYGLKFRKDNRIGLSTIFWQQKSPEKNLYFFNNYVERF